MKEYIGIKLLKKLFSIDLKKTGGTRLAERNPMNFVKII